MKKQTKGGQRAKLAKHNIQTFPLYYEAEKNLDISQAIFVSHSLMARLASRIRKWIDSVVRARSNSKR